MQSAADDVVDAGHSAWAQRLLGASWLVGATVLGLLQGVDSVRPLPAAATVTAALFGLALASGWIQTTAQGWLEALLFATTSSVGVAAVGLPEQREALAACLVLAVPFACALLPARRALLQIGYVLVVDSAVLTVSVRSGGVGVAEAVALWSLVTAVVVGVAVTVHRLREHLHRRTLVAEAVAELGRRALSVTEPDELLGEALSVAVDLMGSDYGTALRKLPDGRVQVAAEVGPEPLPAGTDLLLADSGSYARHILLSQQPFVSEDLSSDTRVTPPAPLLRRGIVSGVAVPVPGSDGPLGVLALHFTRRRSFSRDEVAAATALAAVVATAWEQAAKRQTISHLALHDSLTGLPNRALFLDRLELVVARRPGSAATTSGSAAVMLIDLDDFKAVNDRFGHHAGDQLLVTVAERFTDAVRPEDTVARLGGDEFAVLCEDLPDELAASRLMRRVQQATHERFLVDGGAAEVTASVGVAMRHRGHGAAAGTLLQQADTALYAAKQEGRGRGQLFDERLQQKARTRVRLESELRRGMDQHQFLVHYQPIRSAADQHVLGVEALLRWRHPTRGLLLPVDFIAAAEQTGLIVPLGRWVLQTACAQAARWQQQTQFHDEALWLAVNVSPRQLDDPDLPRDVATAVKETGLEEGSLSLELTETVLLDEGPAGLAALTLLQEAGAHLVLDDFGTGYSSLTHLTRFPISAIKVDQSFVAGLGTNVRDAAVVAAVVALGSELGMRVIAEGVETSEQLLLLERTGCYGVQGFLLDQPSGSPSLDRRPLPA